MIPSVIDNDRHRLADVLDTLLEKCTGGPVDIATAYFAISGYRLVKDRLHQMGAVRLLIGAEPKTGEDVGLRPERRAEYLKLLRGDLEAEPFREETLRLIEDLIAFLRSEKVQVRHFDRGFLHAKAYLFHQDRVGPNNCQDRLRPFAAIVGSSNFTGPGLCRNRELNVVQRVFTAEDAPIDKEALLKAEYVLEAEQQGLERKADAYGLDLPDAARRLIKS
jgi:phosphatidylserine/phosphatidylglycerophosphate/cardiolipin synthase-like enzyme